MDEPPQARYEPLDLELLDLDPDNPRFPGARTTSANPELDFLSQYSNLPDLMASIGAQGFFPGEPIMVVPSGDRYRVIEGNRRVAACKLLTDPTLAPETVRKGMTQVSNSALHKPTALPSLIFDLETDIHRYLGYRHISGVQEWSPVAKARYLRRQFNDLAEAVPDETDRLKAVATRIGSTPAYAARLMTSLAIYELAQERDFFGLTIDARTLSFSLITVAISRRSINQFLGLSSSKDFHIVALREDRLQLLLDWLFVRNGERTVVGDSRNVGKLAEVLADPDGPALAMLVAERDLESAWLSIQPTAGGVENLLNEAIECVEEAKSILVAESRTLSPDEEFRTAALVAVTRSLSD